MLRLTIRLKFDGHADALHLKTSRQRGACKSNSPHGILLPIKQRYIHDARQRSSASKPKEPLFKDGLSRIHTVFPAFCPLCRARNQLRGSLRIPTPPKTSEKRWFTAQYYDEKRQFLSLVLSLSYPCLIPALIPVLIPVLNLFANVDLNVSFCMIPERQLL